MDEKFPHIVYIYKDIHQVGVQLIVETQNWLLIISSITLVVSKKSEQRIRSNKLSSAFYYSCLLAFFIQRMKIYLILHSYYCSIIDWFIWVSAYILEILDSQNLTLKFILLRTAILSSHGNIGFRLLPGGALLHNKWSFLSQISPISLLWVFR